MLVFGIARIFFRRIDTKCDKNWEHPGQLIETKKEKVQTSTYF